VHAVQGEVQVVQTEFIAVFPVGHVEIQLLDADK
jgi:hypothetical protein